MGLIANKVVNNTSDPVTNVITWQNQAEQAGKKKGIFGWLKRDKN